MSTYSIEPHAHDDEVAAAIAAVRCYLEQAVDRPEPPGSAWRAAAVLEGHGLVAARAADRRWSSAARAGRARRWSQGIVGS